MDRFLAQRRDLEPGDPGPSGVALDRPEGGVGRAEGQHDPAEEPRGRGQNPLGQPAVVGAENPDLHLGLGMKPHDLQAERRQGGHVDPHRVHRAERELGRPVGAAPGGGLETAQDVAGDPSADLVIGDAVERETRRLPRRALRAARELADDRILDQRDDLDDRFLLVDMRVGVDHQDVVDAGLRPAARVGEMVAGVKGLGGKAGCPAGPGNFHACPRAGLSASTGRRRR